MGMFVMVDGKSRETRDRRRRARLLRYRAMVAGLQRVLGL